MKRTRLSRMSRLRRVEADVYRRQRRDFLQKHVFCQVRMMVAGGAIAARGHIWSGGMSQQCKRRANQVHHVRGRGQLYLDKNHWLAVCRTHHRWIHENGREAERLGYIERLHEKH